MAKDNYIPPCVDCEDVIAEIQDEFDVSFTEFLHEQQTATITEDGQYHFYGDYVVNVNVEKPLQKHTIIVNQNGEYNFVGNISIKVDVSASVVYRVMMLNVNKLRLIKFYRSALGLGMTEAKTYVESWYNGEANPLLPEKFETYDEAMIFANSGAEENNLQYEITEEEL